MNNKINDKLVDSLARSGISLPDSFWDQIALFREQVSTWNIYASLMAEQALSDEFSAHVYDSLALLPYFPKAKGSATAYVDVGSGAGFPAIPLMLARPDLPSLLVERNQKKAAFLRQVAQKLDLGNATVRTVSFPDVEIPAAPVVYTARAIETPERFMRNLVDVLRPGDLFLSQFRREVDISDSRLAIREVKDEFDDAGLRRGHLAIIQLRGD